MPGPLLFSHSALGILCLPFPVAAPSLTYARLRPSLAARFMSGDTRSRDTKSISRSDSFSALEKIKMPSSLLIHYAVNVLFQINME